MRRRHEKIPITTVLVVNRNKLTFRSSDMDERTVVRVDGERERERARTLDRNRNGQMAGRDLKRTGLSA